MSVYRPKGSSLYHFDFQFKGRRHYGSTGVGDLQEARAIEAAERTKAARAHAYGEPDRKPTMTIDEVFGRYWKEKSQHTAKPGDDMTRFALMASHLGPSLAFHDLSDDKIAVLVARLRGRKVGKESPKMVSNATVNRDIEALRRAWKRAAKLWKIEHGEEPSWGEHLLPEADERVRDLTAAEESRLLEALREDYRPIVKFALLSGIRLGNLRSLKWTDVDYNSMIVRMMAKSKKPGGRNHSVPITAAMLIILANERGKHPEHVFTYHCVRNRGDRKKDDYLPFSQDGWRRAWKTALHKAGLENFRFHDLRHTAATRTLRSSGNMRAVQKMLGHSKITTTTRYAHALDDDVRDAMEAAQSRNNPEAAINGSIKDQRNHKAKA